MFELKKWETPKSYVGQNPVGDLIVLTKNRDSSILESINFDVAKELLQALNRYIDDEPVVYTFTASHFACGWIEYLMIDRRADADVIEAAQKIIDELNEYPILDEDRYSTNKYQSIVDYWSGIGLRERIEWCAKYRESIFAARRDVMTNDLLDGFLNNSDFY